MRLGCLEPPDGCTRWDLQRTPPGRPATLRASQEPNLPASAGSGPPGRAELGLPGGATPRGGEVGSPASRPSSAPPPNGAADHGGRGAQPPSPSSTHWAWGPENPCWSPVHRFLGTPFWAPLFYDALCFSKTVSAVF